MIRDLGGSAKLSTNKPPYQRPNDAWTEVVVQAPATDGSELVAIRQRSLRQKRKVFTWSITAFTAGLLLILLASPFRNELIAPGDLSSPHAQILAAEGADRCAACHDAANQSVGQWISTTLFGKSQASPTQSELCMKCHEKTISSAVAMLPHNVPAKQLAKTTEDASQSSIRAFQASFQFDAPVEHGEIACNACHREHHGVDQNLAAMTDSQCQVCHQNQFHSFESDHPEFTSYPLRRRSSIAFDHNSHAQKHFPEGARAFNCNDCHVDDDQKNVKQLVSFEKGCASCHDESINQSVSRGLTLLALPMLDMEAIEDQNLQVGTWPLAATGDFDGPLTPLMRVLLSADKKAAPLIATLDVHFDFSDIDRDDPQQVRDTVTLVWAIKRLFADLAKNGPNAIQKRIENVLGIQMTEAQLAAVSQTLTRDSLRQTARRWLPNLQQEIPTPVVDEPPHQQAKAKANPEPALKNTRGGVDLNPSDVDWWPEDERVLAMILPDASKSSSLASPSSPNESQAGAIQESDLLATNPLKNLMAKGSENTPENQLPSESGFRLENKLTTKQGPSATSLAQLESNKQMIAGEGDRPFQSSANIAETTSTPFVSPDPIEPSEPPKGWIRDDQTFRITYQPTGHDDNALRQWIDWVAASKMAPTSSVTSPLFSELVAAGGIGDCRSCHTVDQFDSSQDIQFANRLDELTPTTMGPSRPTFQLTGYVGNVLTLQTDGGHHEMPALVANWKAKYRDTTKRSFTKFSHEPHLIQPGLRDCFQCHQLDEQQNNQDTFLGVDPHVFQSNFVPLRLATCASCHRDGSTNNSCTQCHHYHVETP